MLDQVLLRVVFFVANPCEPGVLSGSAWEGARRVGSGRVDLCCTQQGELPRNELWNPAGNAQSALSSGRLSSLRDLAHSPFLSNGAKP